MTPETARRLRDSVQGAYSAAAERPADAHAFPVGAQFALDVGYPPELLDRLPSASVERFAGVSNLAVFAEIAEGDIVLDLGCGAGLDSFAATARRVLGIDFSESMLRVASGAARECGQSNVSFAQAAAEKLPLADGAVDVALVNGIFNLNPNRAAIFAELARVVRKGGTVFAAELILTRPPGTCESSEGDWFA